MRQETISIYKFDELPTEEAKLAARHWYRTERNGELAWMEESKESIEAFCEHFGVTLTAWMIDGNRYHYATDANHSNFRGLKLKQFDPDHMPTGYCLDGDLWGTFYHVWEQTSSAWTAFNAAMDAGFGAWRDDIAHQYSDEHINDVLSINEYEFLEDGKFYE